MWELCISANASPYGFSGFGINSTLHILSARGLANLERQRNVKKCHIEEHGVAQHQKSCLFHYAQNQVHQTSKRIVFLPCCEPVLFCAFRVQNRVLFAWAKSNRKQARGRGKESNKPEESDNDNTDQETQEEDPAQVLETQKNRKRVPASHFDASPNDSGKDCCER